MEKLREGQRVGKSVTTTPGEKKAIVRLQKCRIERKRAPAGNKIREYPRGIDCRSKGIVLLVFRSRLGKKRKWHVILERKGTESSVGGPSNRGRKKAFDREGQGGTLRGEVLRSKKAHTMLSEKRGVPFMIGRVATKRGKKGGLGSKLLSAESSQADAAENLT